MPTFSVPTLAADGRSVSEIVRADSSRAAIAEATSRGLRVAGVPEVVPEPIAKPTPPAPDASPATIDAVFHRIASGGLLLSWLGLLAWPFSIAGIILGAIGGRGRGGEAIIAGFFTLIVNLAATAFILRTLFAG